MDRESAFSGCLAFDPDRADESIGSPLVGGETREEEFRAFAEAYYKQYAKLELRMYEEKQKKRQLQEEDRRREMVQAKSEAYFRGWDDGYRFYKDELANWSFDERQASIKEQEESMKRNAAWFDRRQKKQRRVVAALEVAAPGGGSSAASSGNALAGRWQQRVAAPALVTAPPLVAALAPAAAASTAPAAFALAPAFVSPPVPAAGPEELDAPLRPAGS